MIKGKKVGLREVEPDDLPILKDWRNIQLFRKHFREFRELNLAMQEKWYKEIVVDSPNDFMFVIVELENAKAIGACGLTYINRIIRSAILRKLNASTKHDGHYTHKFVYIQLVHYCTVYALIAATIQCLCGLDTIFFYCIVLPPGSHHWLESTVPQVGQLIFSSFYYFMLLFR